MKINEKINDNIIKKQYLLYIIKNYQFKLIIDLLNKIKTR